MGKENQRSLFSAIRSILVLAIVLLLCIQFWPFSAAGRIEPSFEALFEPHPNDYLKLPPNRAPTNLTEQAFRLYSEERYDQALILFDQIPYHPKSEDIQLFRACALLVQEQFQPAMESLKKISSNSDYYHPALWYQILIYLQLEQENQAKKLLTNYLSLQPTFKREEALALQKNL